MPPSLDDDDQLTCTYCECDITVRGHGLLACGLGSMPQTRLRVREGRSEHAITISRSADQPIRLWIRLALADARACIYISKRPKEVKPPGTKTRARHTGRSDGTRTKATRSRPCPRHRRHDHASHTAKANPNNRTAWAK